MHIFSTSAALGLLIVFLLIGVPVAVSLILAAFIGSTMLIGFGPTLSYLGVEAYGSVSKFLITPIPLFVLMGEILAVSGIGTDMFDAAMKWFGRFRGGLAVASIVACAVFAAMCGLSMAGAATIGVVAIPEMIKRGYDKGLATGSVAIAGTLGILIPPSLPFIMYGLVADVSVGKLFIAGIGPGILLTLLFSGFVFFKAWRQPHVAPGLTGITWKERFVSLKKLWVAVALIFFVLGSIYLGVATPTEAAGIGALGALLIALGYRTLNFERVIHLARRTLVVVGFAMFLIVGGMYLSHFLVMTGLTQTLSDWIISLHLPALAVIAAISVILILLGCFLDSTAIILITTPLFLPIVAHLGVNPIVYGVFLVMNIEIAFVTPPVGLNLYVVHNISRDVHLGTVLRGALPFLLLAIVGIAMVVVFPEITLWLPSHMVR